MWAWVALAAAGGAVFFIWRSRSNANNAPQSTTSGVDTAAANGLDVGQYEALLALLRDIQGAQSQDLAGEQGETEPPEQPGTVSTQPVGTPTPVKTPTAPPKQAPAQTAQYVTVVKYTSKNPPWNSTLSGIASHYHTSVGQLLKLNPSIKNPNLIYPGQKVRYK